MGVSPSGLSRSLLTQNAASWILALTLTNLGSSLPVMSKPGNYGLSGCYFICFVFCSVGIRFLNVLFTCDFSDGILMMPYCHHIFIHYLLILNRFRKPFGFEQQDMLKYNMVNSFRRRQGRKPWFEAGFISWLVPKPLFSGSDNNQTLVNRRQSV